MRAVKNNLPTPSGELRNQKALARANGTSWRASGWAGEKAARSRNQSGHPINSTMKAKAIYSRVSVTCGQSRELVREAR